MASTRYDFYIHESTLKIQRQQLVAFREIQLDAHFSSLCEPVCSHLYKPYLHAQAQRVVEFMEGFQYVHRVFNKFTDLTPAIIEAHRSKDHVEPETRAAILEYLNNPDCRLFGAQLKRETVEKQDMDDFLHQAGDCPKALKHLSDFDAVKRRFYSAKDVVVATKFYNETKTHISKVDRDAIIAYVMNPSCTLINKKLMRRASDASSRAQTAASRARTASAGSRRRSVLGPIINESTLPLCEEDIEG